MKKILSYTFFTMTLCVLITPTASALSVSVMFSDHMMLQRDMPVPVWGNAGANETVTVEFRDQKKQVTSDKDGKWLLKLDPLKVGEPGKMTVTGSSGEKFVFDDVLVGEVWFGSGQSNMVGDMGRYSSEPALKAMLDGCPHPQLRLYRGGWKQAATADGAQPEGENTLIYHGGWNQATADTSPRMSALLFAFGYSLQKELGVPVGLVVGAAGGTASSEWLPEEMIADDKDCVALLEKDGNNLLDSVKRKADYEAKLAEWERISAAERAKGGKEPAKPREPLDPGNRYTKRVISVVPYAIRGVLWDQGESGTGIPAIDQYTMMGALIHGWRKAWGQDFPWIYVQKPSGGGCAWDITNPATNRADAFVPHPVENNAADAGKNRETHIRIMQHPKTAMVSSSDLGGGVHPGNRSGYGARACRVALALAYGKDVEIYGPLYESHSAEGNTLCVKFSHAESGLAVPEGQKLQGFEIAGTDGNYRWADAKIVGKTVLLTSENVPAPVSVRYAWAESIPWANLFNGEQLPALTFRAEKPQPVGKQ